MRINKIFLTQLKAANCLEFDIYRYWKMLFLKLVKS